MGPLYSVQRERARILLSDVGLALLYFFFFLIKIFLTWLFETLMCMHAQACVAYTHYEHAYVCLGFMQGFSLPKHPSN